VPVLEADNVVYEIARNAGGAERSGPPANGQGKGKRRLLDGVSLELAEGELLCLMGASGSGKSTLLKLFNRLLEPVSGRLYAFGKPLQSFPPRSLRRQVVLVPQTPHGLPGTVRDNLLAPLRFASAPEKPLDSVLELVSLSPELLDQSPETLSVGERQRMALARALILDPPVLLLDEPTSALDPDTGSAVEQLAVRLCHELGKSVLFVTHSPQQAERVADRLVVLQRGRITASGQVKPVLEQVLPTWVEAEDK